jgi:hypothetical protein
MKRIILAALSVMLVASAMAQISMTTTGSNTQNFNTLITSGTATWVNNSTISNWYVTNTSLRADAGSNVAAGIKSYGTGTATDRALGSIETNAGGAIAYGVQLQNNSSTAITSATLAYTGEQWRKENNGNTDQIAAYYLVSSSPISSITNTTSGWTLITGLTFTSPIIGASTATTLNGNTAANRTVFSATALPSLSVPAGQYLIIKWVNANASGTDHGLGIDDVTIAWTVTPACTNAGITSATADDNTLCPSATASLTANSVVGTNAVLTWWTGTGGTGTELGPSNPLTGVSAGTYYARVTADCGSPVEASVTVSSVSAPSTSSITGSASPACNATGQVYSVTNTAGSSYSWTVPSGASITSGAGTNSITVSFGNTNGNITVTETNSNGCVGSAVSLTISLTGCSIDADFTASSTVVCAGNSITFTNTTAGASGGATYSWNFGTGASPATASGIGPHTVTYSTAGAATVVLTVTDGVTNTETKTNYITITALPTASAGSAVAAICQGATTTALGGSFGGSATSAVWSDGGAGGTFANNTGSTPGTATYTASGSAPSTVTLTLTTSGGGCGTATDSKTLTVNSVPTAPVLNGGVTPQITNVNNTDFLANWAASAGATGYYLDVATSPTFSLGGTFATEGFNNSMTLFAGSPTYYTGNSGTGDRPQSTAYAQEGTHAAGVSNNTRVLTSNIIDASSYSGVSMSFRLASWSISSTGNGADGADFVLVEVSPDGGTTYYETIQVEGNGNAYWAYSATGVASTAYDGDATAVVFAPASGGNRTTDGYSTVTISNLPEVANLRIRITLDNNSANERWTIDNLTLSGSGSTYVPGYENLAVSGLSQSVTGLSEEVTYYYRVRATNDCGTSANSSTVSVTTTCSAPTTAASAVNVSTVSTTSLSLGWTSGNGVSRIVVARAGAAPTGTPSNLTTYTANADITLASALGDGFVVYNGTGNSATITGLTPGTQYYFTVYEYNCGATREQYLITSAPTGNNYTLPSNVTLTELCTDNSTHQLSWTFGTGGYDGVLIFARQGATSSGPGVSDVTTYTGANADYTLAADYAAKGKLVYAGSGTSVTITGLTSGLNYTFSAFTYKNNTATKWSSGTSASQTIVLSDVTLASAASENQQVNVGWTNPNTGCYDEILVVANAGTVVFTPSGDGTAYTANAAYSAANQVVYKGTSTGVTVTSLTNGTNYCFKIFVRKGTEWSLGSEVCAIPNTSTEFGPGDLAIVAVNTQVLGSGGTDEVCFVAFKDITAGTSFYMTDNGFERTTADLWGDTEGVMRFTRSTGTSTIAAGTVICINGPYTSAPYYDIIVCGVDDTGNWQVDANTIGSGATQFNLNTSDQVWIMQGGAWSNPSGSHNATYNGNLLYGWSGIAWKANIGSTPTTWDTDGSRLIPGTECFTTELSTVTDNDKTKYTGPVTATTRLGWIARINNASNWTGYADNSAYDAAPAAYDYFSECIVFPINAPTETAGKWTGSKNDDWFDCANWDTKEVPDSTINVIIEDVSGANNNCNVNYNATNAYLYNNIASCNDITITDKELRLTGNVLDVLEVHGDLSIGTNGTLDMSDGSSADDGVILLHGNWSNQVESNFKQGDCTIELIGTTTQSITTADTEEVFNHLVVDNAAGITLNDHVQVEGTLTMTQGVITNTGVLFELGVSTSDPGTLTYSAGRITGEFKRWMTTTGTNYLFPIGTTTANQNATFNFSNLTDGALTLRFQASNPGTTGLPLYESALSFNNTFTNGYWSGTASGGLASTGYALSLDGTGFTGYTQDADVRILRRAAAGSWTLNGTHTAAVGAVANRSAMNTFGEYALAPAVRCVNSASSPSILTQTLCDGEPITNITVTPADGEAPFSYQWYINSSASTVGATSLGAANGAQTITLTPSNTLIGTNYYFLEISQPGSACPPVVSAFSQVIVNALPTASITGSAVICEGESTDLTITATGTGTISGTLSDGTLFSGSAPTITVSVSPLTNTTYTIASLSDANCTASAGNLTGSATITVNTLTPTSVSIVSDVPSPICAGTAVQFTATPTGGGASPSYQWYIGATPVGSNSSLFSTTALNNSDVVTVQMTSNAVCPNPTTATSNSITYVVTPQPTWYQDADGDAYTSGNTLVQCSQPTGYVLITSLAGGVATPVDCNDTNEDVNPGADEWCNGVDDNCAGGIDEGLGTATFYYDNDNDGYGDPLNPVTACVQPEGTVTENTDCNDALFAVNPAATEICDGINNDCDAFIDEGCGPINDERNNALPLALTNYTNTSCATTTGTLLGAQVSPEALSTAITGEDVWYYFIAQDGGISIQCTSTVNNLLLELQTEDGVIIDTENVQSTIGNETLNYGQLIPGETYLLCVRNYNSAQGAGGSFSLCSRILATTECFEENYTLNLCSQFKVDFTGGAQFIYHFGSGITFSGVYSAPPALPATTRIVLNTVPGLTYNMTIPEVWIDAVYALTDGAGTPEMLTVVGIDTCQLNILPHADLDVRTTDQNNIPGSPITRPKNAFIACEPFICGVATYDWSFRKVDLTGAVTALDSVVVNSGTSSRYIRLNTANLPGLQAGDRFRVKIRPRLNYAGNPTPVPGDWGTDFQYVRITPSAGMTMESPDLTYDLVLFEKEMAGENFADIYPNPNAGDRMMLNAVNQEDGVTSVRIMDVTGKQVWAKKYVAEAGVFATEITPENGLTPGLYLVEIILNNNTLVSHKVVVQ